MTKLKKREEKLKEVRKNTPWREFVKKMASWLPLVYQKTDNGIISRYPETKRAGKVVSMEKFKEIQDDMEDFSVHPSGDFFEQFEKLFREIPIPSRLDYGGNENCEFGDAVVNSKNVYLTYGAVNGCENVLYSHLIKENSKNVLNSVVARDNSENVYFSTGVIGGFNIFYSKFIQNSSDIRFSDNMTGCSNCILCSGLTNKSFCIENEELSKEEYFKKKKQILENKEKFSSYYNRLDEKSNFIIESENIENGLLVYKVKNGRNLILVGGKEGDRDMFDAITAGSPSCQDIYGVMGTGLFSQNIYNSVSISGGSNIYYSYFLTNCSHCLGCIGLKNKEFCIFNKQYSKEEWFKKVDEIFQKMEEKEIFGEFFPGRINPFYFNDTLASLIDPAASDSFDKQEVQDDNYMRRDEKIKVDVPKGANIIQASELGEYEGYDEDGNWKIDSEILKKVIEDKQGNYYRIIKMEYKFLEKHGLPLPRIHWLDRIKKGFQFE